MKNFRIDLFSAVLLLAVCRLDLTFAQCGAGSYLVGSGCQACEPGSFSPGNSATCENCNSGTSTIGSAATSSANCYTLCALGQFYSSSGNQCYDCSYGQYQDNSTTPQGGIAVTCKQCPNNGHTAVTGVIFASQCRPQCSLGAELLPTLNCQSCPVGKYRSQSELFCADCPAGRQTPGTGSTSAADCTVVICSPGEYNSGGSCTRCADGYYQDQAGQNVCKPCGTPPTNWRTGTVGATNQGQCIFYCQDGLQNVNQICMRCNKGTYRSNAINGFGSSCQNCPNGLTTQFDGQARQSDCNQAICAVGKYTNPTNAAACLDCPADSYNDQVGAGTCKLCDPGYKTDGPGKMSRDDCKYACPAGQDERPAGSRNCQNCPIGYYKDANNPFSSCQVCPNGYITQTDGSRTSALCTIPNCQAGTFRNVLTNNCEPCPVGQYQTQKWQTSCTACPGATPITILTGSDDVADCKLDCPSGYEANAAGTVCNPCPDNKYRDATKTFTCQVCPNQLFSERPGATSALQCVVRDCPAGQFSDATSNQCQSCAKGWYSDSARQSTCLRCPAGSTTSAVGADSINLCILTCPKGQQPQAGVCEVCSIGWYKNSVSPDPCLQCPGSFVTKTTGAQTAGDCSVAKCTGDGKGYYWNTDSSYACTKCPKGEYQNKPYQTACIMCPPGTTTYIAGNGASDLSQCLSTNECEIPSLNTCSVDATCTDTDSGFTCECKPGFTGNGLICTNLCDVIADPYCKNGTCFKETYGVRCDCDDNYTGDRCDERDVPDDKLPIIIGSVFGAVFGLIIIVLLTLFCCHQIRRSYRKKPAPEQPKPQPVRVKERVVEKYFTPPIMDLPGPPPPPAIMYNAPTPAPAYYEDAPFVPALPPPPTIQVPFPVPVQGAPIVVQSAPYMAQGLQQFGTMQSVGPMGGGNVFYG